MVGGIWNIISMDFGTLFLWILEHCQMYASGPKDNI